MIAMQVSLYPLGEDDLKAKLDIFWDVLKKGNINFKITPLSTITWADDEEKLVSTVFNAYKEVRKNCRAVMVSTTTMGNKDDIDELLKYL
jgi:hypothetical protein